MQEHDTQAALSELERIESHLRSDPANPHLLAMAVDKALAAGLADRALAHAEMAVQSHPGDDFLLARLGNVRLAQRRYTEAAELFDELMTRHSEAALAYGAAQARYFQGQHNEARALLEPYADGEALPLAAVTLLARVLHLTGAPEQALGVARRHGGGDPFLLAAGSLAALDCNELEQAQALASAALAGAPRPAEALLTAGSLALAQMDSAEAEALFDEVLTQRPEEGRAWSALGMISLLRRDLDAAHQQLESALRFMPGHVGTWHGMGWCLLFTGDHAGAEAAFAQALELDRNFGESHGGLAVAQALAGQRDEARRSIDRALGLDSQGLAARYAQMVLDGVTDDPERFRQLARRLMTARQVAFGRKLSDLMDLYEGRQGQGRSDAR